MKRILFLAAAVPLLVLTLGAAGPAAATPQTDPDEQGGQIAQCLRDHGVDVPEQPADGERTTFTIGPDAREALEACAPHGLGRPVEVDPAVRAQMQEFVECLRDNGVELPEPGLVRRGADVLADGDRTAAVLVAVPRAAADPEVDAAHEACRDLLPERPAGGIVISRAGDVVAGEAIPAIPAEPTTGG